jgi:hypothetical protein
MELSSFWREVTEFALQLTARVGSQLLADFGQARSTEKADGSLVTSSDKWADRAFQEAIAAAYPNHGYLSEESNHIFPRQSGAGWWIPSMAPPILPTGSPSGAARWRCCTGACLCLAVSICHLSARLFTAIGPSFPGMPQQGLSSPATTGILLVLNPSAPAPLHPAPTNCLIFAPAAAIGLAQNFPARRAC